MYRNVSMHVCMYTCMHVYLYACMQCAYVCRCACMHGCMFVGIACMLVCTMQTYAGAFERARRHRRGSRRVPVCCDRWSLHFQSQMPRCRDSQICVVCTAVCREGLADSQNDLTANAKTCMVEAGLLYVTLNPSDSKVTYNFLLKSMVRSKPKMVRSQRVGREAKGFSTTFSTMLRPREQLVQHGTLISF